MTLRDFESDTWKAGYDAGYEAGRKAERESSNEDKRGHMTPAESWNYEGLGGYGSQER